MHVPNIYLRDAILIACFLINRMPSSVFHYKIPVQIRYPHRPLFPLPRTFGCVVLVHDLQPGLDKLSPRAIKCVFLSYARNQKDYRCFDPASRKVFVNADVTFFEE